MYINIVFDFFSLIRTGGENYEFCHKNCLRIVTFPYNVFNPRLIKEESPIDFYMYSLLAVTSLYSSRNQ